MADCLKTRSICNLLLMLIGGLAKRDLELLRQILGRYIGAIANINVFLCHYCWLRVSIR